MFLDFRPTLFFGVPTIYVRLLDLAAEPAREIGRVMRLFVSGSAPLPAQVFEEFRERFGHAILERYGMRETLMNISNPYAGERRPGTVGMPLPGVSARIVDGEIHLRGPNVFAGYWRRDEATRAAFVDGWFRTGDLAERVGGRLLHTARPQERRDHLRRFQHLSARDRRVSAGTGGSGGGGRGGRCRTASAAKCRWRMWCSSGELRVENAGGAVPGGAGVVQSAACVHSSGKAATQCAGENSEAPVASIDGIRQLKFRLAAGHPPELVNQLRRGFPSGGGAGASSV